MDIQQRGRSPSAGQRANIRHSPSPSPHAPFPHNVSGLGFDPTLSVHDPSSSTTFQVTTAAFDPSHYLTTTQGQQYPQQTSLADQSYLQPTQTTLSQHNTPQFGPQGNNISPDPLDISHTTSPDFNHFFTANDINQNQAINPSFLGNTLDPQLLDAQPQQNPSISPSDLISQMATTQQGAPTPPHLLPTMNHRQTPSPQASPNMNQGQFTSPGHSRHASLDPNAAYGQGTEWGNMANFRGHRRAPSETYSDVSSAHASPYLVQQDSFETDQPSPLLNAQNDPQLFHDPVMQFGQFNLNDSNAHISPGHSPHISPRLNPQQQQSLPQFQPGSFGLEQGMNNQYAQQGMGTYQNQGPEPFPSLNQGIPEFGQADAMSPPEINIDFAPPSRQASFEPPKPEHQADALSPPDRSRSRNRIRAKSDPFSGASSRASTPGSEVHRSLSPSAAKSRSPSPSSKSSRRSSTSSVPNRDYILDLADPSRPAPADGSNPKRTQKHPATFQCTLCPKRFTRAYNLRSHLRTHTDERPFVCSVCGKAFARQHDRKRHEGLHSGEKKFVCRGNLKDGNHWGCGRRFARADALGRHFRSEAGRVCIRPLLEEEAQEKGGWDGQNQQMNNGNGMFAPMPAQNFGSGMIPQPGFEQFPQGGGMQAQQFLPAALLAQYPALAGIQWDQLPPGPPDEVEGDISGRSSFDASSGGEFFDEESDYQNQQPIYGGNGGGWASDSYDGR
ncbi:uncharacterized protein K460DRAFT_270262 [Cucurbitaria berberidis CBS 394.84]|uniref:C2H2 type master regulator of conidiophore development brlA n=1 Tax=Cucurbitaria berberidis CBS 394.84 TaxID=1168544 RepID=A0A9P4GQV6_9PLEO|nr:uncharacterized protein K460DRAFT_270262 [Cucurbitaria berberidis CBS 394.84]KAF1849869.1 hypothetical protein K460DRAFT_270262 [Cucurbitaria berberidis CBS 394.84]